MDVNMPISLAEYEKLFQRLIDAGNERLKDENNRQNERIKLLENNVREITSLASSVKNLDLSMQSMVREQEKQGKRLEVLEGRDGEKWRTVVSHIITTAVGAVVMYILTRIGL